MKKTLLPLVLGLGLVHSALLAQSSVWKISKGDAVVYLGGTCHVLRQADLPLPAEFDAAFAASSHIFFETDLARMQSPEMQQVVMQRGLFTDGKTLDKVLTPEAWAGVSAYAQKNGIPLGQVATMRPWFVALMITVMELQKIGVTQEGVDLHYAKKIPGTGKKTGELETFEAQVEFIVNMGAGHESEMITNTLDDLNDLPATFTKLIAAWKTGDLAQIDALMIKDMKDKYPAIYQSLMVERNRNWLPRIEAMFTTPEIEFVLVGAGHLAGSDGLITELKAKGYTIEQLKVSKASPAN